MADSLDSIVKGAPVGGTLDGQDLAKSVAGTSPIASSTTGKAGDPLNHTPSSPSMIYLNLLILEASLRAQYLELRARRRHHTFFLALLTLWTAGFGYALFLAPREDGRGMGGSVYWMVESTERICFLGGIMTGVLVWAVGIWDRGVRWPRRWLAVSNRGLRAFNCKLVVVKRPWWRELLGTIAWFLTYGLFAGASSGGASSYRYVDPAVLREVDREMRLSAPNHPALPVLSETAGADEEKAGHEEDLAPGGDYVKLLLLPKPFSPTFRENWELYRSEYWERENERRAVLRAKIKERDRRLVRQHGGLFWWLPWRRSKLAAEMRHRSDPEKTQHLHHHHPHSRQAALVAEHRRPRSNSGSGRRSSTSTASNSRSPTPTRELEGGVDMSRKSSSASNAGSVSEKRRKRLGSSSLRGPNRPRVDSRSITPEIPSPLAKGSTISGRDGEATS